MNGEGVIELLKEGKDLVKYLVCGSIPAPEIPPTFNNSLVVTVDPKVSARASNPGDHPNEEFKANGFCPSNVSGTISLFPTQDEAPSSPSVLDGDGNAEA